VIEQSIIFIYFFFSHTSRIIISYIFIISISSRSFSRLNIISSRRCNWRNLLRRCRLLLISWRILINRRGIIIITRRLRSHWIILSTSHSWRSLRLNRRFISTAGIISRRARTINSLLSITTVIITISVWRILRRIYRSLISRTWGWILIIIMTSTRRIIRRWCSWLIRRSLRFTTRSTRRLIGLEIRFISRRICTIITRT